MRRARRIPGTRATPRAGRSGHPEKVVDFGWRAVHEMTTTAKRIITSHYDQAPRFSYWTGCSAGGRQAMKAAQRFPEDFNGIVAGAPGLDWTSRAARAVQVEKALQANPDARLLPPARQLLHAAVVAACDAHRRRQGRPHRKPAPVQVRSRRAGMPRRRGWIVPVQGAGRNRAPDVCRRGPSQDEAHHRRPRAGERAGMDGSRMDRLGTGHRPRSIPLHRLRRSGVDDRQVQCRHRRRTSRRGRPRHHQRTRSQPEALPRPRRKDDCVPRLERSADLAVERHSLSSARAGNASARRK